jgi:putative Holliday junction resolvase
MGRLLCLDYGKKRVGVAVTDTLKIIASGLETIPTHEIREYLKSYIAGEELDGLIVGYPKTLRNEPSEAVRYIDPFLKWFKKEFPAIPVALYDERFTSRMAERSLIESGVPKMARRDKSLVDKISASLILQSYMDAVKNRDQYPLK